MRKLALVHDHIEIEPSPIRNKILEIITSFEGRFTELDDEREHRLDQMESGDESEPGGLKEVKVYIAAKRKLGVGDKMFTSRSAARYSRVTRWPVATATKASLPKSSRNRICPSSRTVLRWISF